MRILTIFLASAAVAAPAVAVAGPSSHAPAWDRSAPEGFQQVAYRHDRDRRHVRRVYRGDDGRYRCERDDGTTGLVIGAVGGGVIGHEVAGRGDRTIGTLVGAGIGALVGREIDRDDIDCR